MPGQQPLHHPRHTWQRSHTRAHTTSHYTNIDTQAIVNNHIHIRTAENPETMQEIQNINNTNTKVAEQTPTKPPCQTTQNTHNPMTLPRGHPIQNKDKHTIRLLLQNIRGIDLTTTGSIKLVALQKKDNFSLKSYH